MWHKTIKMQENYLYFKEQWKKIESVKTYPHYLRNIIIMDADNFVDKVLNASEREAKDMVNSIYNGDAYILKNAFSDELVEDLKQKVYNWSLTVKPGFHEMRDGCPDYHCINSTPNGPKGGYTSLEHSYVFFRHNKSELNIFEPFEKYWEAIKVLGGNKKEIFKNNAPSDGIIDRITFLQYPIGYGKITKHYDSSRSQKLLLGNLFTQIGEDYDYGVNGFYLVDKNQKNIYIENIAQKGDFVCVSPTMYHGVPTIKKADVSSKTEWDNINGRWYLQCYSAESHEVKNRQYSVAIEDEAGHGPIANYIGSYDE